jgi:hypothetical protein
MILDLHLWGSASLQVHVWSMNIALYLEQRCVLCSVVHDVICVIYDRLVYHIQASRVAISWVGYRIDCVK